MRRLKQTLLLPERLLAIVLLALLVALRLFDPAPVEILRLKAFDLMQQSQPRATPADLPVVIVDIDEDSLRRYGQWPWPRTLLARVVDRLAEAKTQVVGFDVLFPEPDRLSGPALAQALQETDADLRSKLAALPSGESKLALAMQALPVVIGVSGYDKPVPADKPPRTSGILRGDNVERFLRDYPGLVRAQPELEAAAAGLGLVTVMPERDGIVRRVPTLLMTQGAMLPTLDLELLRLKGGGQPIIVRANPAGIAEVVVTGRTIQTDRNGQIWVNFGAHDPVRFVSAADLLEGRVPPERLAGRIALIGSSAVALFDLRTTPLDPLIPGVEIHAQVLENVLAGSMLVRPNFAVAVELTVLCALVLLFAWAVPILGALRVLLLGAILGGAVAAAGWLLFAQHRFLFDLSFPVIGPFSIFIVLVFFNYWREEARRAQIRSAFSQYVSADLVETLAREPDRLKLGGESRELTVLFSDVRGFTTISESFKGDPEGLVALMNGMLTPLSNAILDQRGTIDKYMGDAILAFWNAPLDDPEHAGRACLAALDMMTRLEALNQQRQQEAERMQKPYLPIRIGVGINTGTCVVGNFGSDMRFDYSVLGDSVNTASRLEGLTDTYGVGILVGDNTARSAGRHVAMIAIDRVRVKGKTQPETVHVVLGPKAMASLPWFVALEAAVARMLESYSAGDWTEAAARLEACRSADAERKMSGFFDAFGRRLQDLSTRPAPAAGWDGITTFTSKDGATAQA